MTKSIILAGEDISEYTVVISEKASDTDRDAAGLFCTYIERMNGYKPSILTDSSYADREIVIGNTNRENDKIKSKASLLKNDGIYLSFDNQKRLFILGEGDFGVMNAVCRLLEVFGVRFYDENTEEILYGDISLEADFELFFSPVLMYRKTDWQLPREFLLKHGVNGQLSTKNSIIGFCHTMAALAECPHHTQPCLSDEKVYSTVLKNVRKTINDNPGCRIISVTQNDNFNYCKCEKCSSLAEKENQSGVMLNFINRLAEDIEKDFPEVYILTFAYQYTRKPPVTIKPRRNVIIWLCSIECCFSHALTDRSCEQNKEFVKDIEDWSKISDNIYIWDYITNFAHYIAPFPNFRTMPANVRFFADNKAIAIYEEGGYQQAENGEFRSLRAYLTCKLLWDPYMSDDEYQRHISEFLACYYGKGWRYVREYIDRCCDIAEKIHLGIYIRPEALFVDKDKNPDLQLCISLDSLWDKAYAEAESERQKRNCQNSSVQSKYILTYIGQMVSGKVDPAENRALIELMKNAGIIFQSEWYDMGRVDEIDENLSVREWRKGPWA